MKKFYDFQFKKFFENLIHLFFIYIFVLPLTSPNSSYAP